MCELLWVRLSAQLTLERQLGWEVVQRCGGTGNAIPKVRTSHEGLF